MKVKFGNFFLLFFLLCLKCFASDVPFTIEKGYVIVPVKVKKDISVEMIINTGLDFSIVDADSIKKNKFPSPSYTGVGQITGHNDQTVVFNEISDILLGDENLNSMFMKFSDLTNLKQKIGRDIFGILGADFFKGKYLKFDFKNKILSFSKQSKTQEFSLSKAGSFPIVYRMSQTAKNVFGKEITLPVVDDVNINGKKVKTLFDTGTISALLILPSVSKELNIDSAEKDQNKSLQIKSLKFFDYEINGVPATILGRDVVPEQYKKGFGAVLGVGVLQNFTVTFDFKKGLIILEK